METMYISDKKVYHLPRIRGVLFVYYLENMKKVIKLLSEYEMEDKKYILNEIYRNRKDMPYEFIIPDYLVKGETVNGYMMPFVEGYNLSSILNCEHITLKDKIYYLKKIGKLLEKLKNYEDLHINDLHEDNILVDIDTKQIKVLDMDTIKINNSLTFPAKYLGQFSLINTTPKYRLVKTLEEYAIADRNTDIYCYSIMILNYLADRIVDCMSKEEFNNYLNYLDSIGMDRELLDVFHRLIEKEDNINPMDYLDSITEEQVLKARINK